MKFIAFVFNLFVLSFNLVGQDENLIVRSEISSSIPKELEVLVYPNPILDQCIVEAEEGTLCLLLNLDGVELGKWVVDFSSRLVLSFSNWQSGTFLLILEKDGNKTVKKMVML